MPTGRYTVHQVADARMPEGCPWAIVEIPAADGRGGADVMLIVARSAFGPEVMADAWAAGRRLRFSRRPIPAQADPLQLVV